jgi:hypothetical protein
VLDYLLRRPDQLAKEELRGCLARDLSAKPYSRLPFAKSAKLSTMIKGSRFIETAPSRVSLHGSDHGERAGVASDREIRSSHTVPFVRPADSFRKLSDAMKRYRVMQGWFQKMLRGNVRSDL